MKQKRKICSKNNQKMLPVLDYGFGMPILILNLLICQFLILLEKCQI